MNISSQPRDSRTLRKRVKIISDVQRVNEYLLGRLTYKTKSYCLQHNHGGVNGWVSGQEGRGRNGREREGGGEEEKGEGDEAGEGEAGEG